VEMQLSDIRYETSVTVLSMHRSGRPLGACGGFGHHESTFHKCMLRSSFQADLTLCDRYSLFALSMLVSFHRADCRVKTLMKFMKKKVMQMIKILGRAGPRDQRTVSESPVAGRPAGAIPCGPLDVTGAR
jgi:hypothetical protein